jgi:hypothetical protein
VGETIINKDNHLYSMSKETTLQQKNLVIRNKATDYERLDQSVDVTSNSGPRSVAGDLPY